MISVEYPLGVQEGPSAGVGIDFSAIPFARLSSGNHRGRRTLREVKIEKRPSDFLHLHLRKLSVHGLIRHSEVLASLEDGRAFMLEHEKVFDILQYMELVLAA